MKCPTHNVEMDVDTQCGVCHGEGIIEDSEDYGPKPALVECYQCKGTGYGYPDCYLCIDEIESRVE